MANRFLGRGCEYEDLYEYGCIGLMKAVDRFDPEYGVAFSTYAVPLIVGEIKRFLRGDGAVHVSRTIRENTAKVARALEESGGETQMEELSRRTGLNRQDVALALSAMRPVRSLSEPISGDGETQLQDMLGKDEGSRVNDAIALRQALDTLDQKERRLIVMRYFRCRTQTSLAAELGMTQVQISRMEKKILEKLRTILQ